MRDTINQWAQIGLFCAAVASLIWAQVLPAEEVVNLAFVWGLFGGSAIGVGLTAQTGKLLADADRKRRDKQ